MSQKEWISLFCITGSDGSWCQICPGHIERGWGDGNKDEIHPTNWRQSSCWRGVSLKRSLSFELESMKQPCSGVCRAVVPSVRSGCSEWLIEMFFFISVGSNCLNSVIFPQICIKDFMGYRILFHMHRRHKFSFLNFHVWLHSNTPDIKAM